jgi:hypothetical protein
MNRALDVFSLAARLECSRSMVRKLIAQVWLQPFRLRTAIRIRPEKIERLEGASAPTERKPTRPARPGGPSWSSNYGQCQQA